MRLMGVTEESIEKELEREDLDVVEIWPEHMDAWQLFVEVQHQWRVPAFGGKPFGLDYPSVEMPLKLMFPRKRRLQIFKQLKLIEAGALKAWPTK